MNPITTIPNMRPPGDRIPTLDERKAYMADLHVALMHGEAWYGILKEPPVREPKPILSWKDEAVLAILAEGPAYKAVIAARLEDENESVMDNLRRLSHESLIVGRPGALPGTVLWHITPSGRRTHSAQAGRVKARDMRIRTPKRQTEQTAKPGPVAKPDDYLYTGTRILTPNQVAAESGECTVYLLNPHTGIPEPVKVIPMGEPLPPEPEKPTRSKPRLVSVADDPRGAEAVRLYRDVGLTCSDVARTLHIKDDRLRLMLRTHGVTIRVRGTRWRPPHES